MSGAIKVLASKRLLRPAPALTLLILAFQLTVLANCDGEYMPMAARVATVYAR